MLNVRQTQPEDIEQALEILEAGKKAQLEQGNLNQWRKDYPNRDNIIEDMAHGESYVVEDTTTGELVGTLCILKRPEPTYVEIDGEWLDDDQPYVTIHRIASIRPGVGAFAIQHAIDTYGNVRIDTHKNNHRMLGLINKLGFTYCGVATMLDGGLRDAFQLIKPS